MDRERWSMLCFEHPVDKVGRPTLRIFSIEHRSFDISTPGEGHEGIGTADDVLIEKSLRLQVGLMHPFAQMDGLIFFPQLFGLLDPVTIPSMLSPYACLH